MNKQVKWKYEPYAYYNKTAIEEHLTKMAKEGWMIESMGYLWKYQKIEPQNRTFRLVYIPDIDDADDDLTDKQKEAGAKQRSFVQQQEEEGWTFAAVYAEMLVFYRDDKSVSMSREEALQTLDAIDAIVQKKGKYSTGYVIFFFCLVLFFFLLLLFTEPLYLLSDQTFFWAIPGFAAVLGFQYYLRGCYKKWYQEAQHCADENGTIPKLKERLFMKNGMDLSLICIIFLFCGIMEMQSWAIVAVIPVLIIGNCFTDLAERVKGKVRYKRLKGIKTRDFSTLIIVPIIILMLCFIWTMNGNVDENNEAASKEAVLVVTDLYEDYVSDEDDWYEVKESFLAKTETQVSGKVDYYYIEVKRDWLYDTALKLFCRQEGFDLERMTEIDATPWHAEKVYQDGTRYAVFWQNCMLSLYFLSSPTDEQIAVIAENLNK